MVSVAFVAIALSTAALLVLLVVNYAVPTFLAIDARWLIVAAVPLFVCLVVSGYVTKFKGLGVELELVAKSSVARVSLKVEDAASKSQSVFKRSMPELSAMTERAKLAVTTLVFFQERASDYDVLVIKDYLRILSNVRYMEVRKDGNFACLIPVSAFLGLDGSDVYITEFLRCLGKPDHPGMPPTERSMNDVVNSLKTTFGQDAITESISADTDILMALRTMKKLQLDALVILSPGGQLAQIVERRTAEARICEAVLSADK